jgi:hypothetical protein
VSFSEDLAVHERFLNELRQINRTFVAIGCPPSTLFSIATAAGYDTEELEALVRAERHRLRKLRQSQDEAL